MRPQPFLFLNPQSFGFLFHSLVIMHFSPLSIKLGWSPKLKIRIEAYIQCPNLGHSLCLKILEIEFLIPYLAIYDWRMKYIGYIWLSGIIPGKGDWFPFLLFGMRIYSETLLSLGFTFPQKGEYEILGWGGFQKTLTGIAFMVKIMTSVSYWLLNKNKCFHLYPKHKYLLFFSSDIFWGTLSVIVRRSYQICSISTPWFSSSCPAFA